MSSGAGQDRISRGSADPVAIGFGVNTMLGSQCALLPELFGNRHRYIGVATAREFSAVLAGGMAPVTGAWLISISSGAWWPVATYVFVLSVITFGTTFLVPETRGRDLTLIEDASRDTAEQVSQRPASLWRVRAERRSVDFGTMRVAANAEPGNLSVAAGPKFRWRGRDGWMEC